MRRVYKADSHNKLLVANHYLFGGTQSDGLRIVLWSGNLPVRADHYVDVSPDEEARLDYALASVSEEPFSQLVAHGNRLRDAIRGIERAAHIVSDQELDVSPFLFDGGDDHWQALRQRFRPLLVSEREFREAWGAAVRANRDLLALETRLIG